MIKITYQYQCDICGGEAKKSDEFNVVRGSSFQYPDIMNRLGHYDVCEQCLETFYAKKDELFPVNQGS